MSVSKIEWTDSTWNPIRGCSRISEGCRNCYAEAFAARFSEPTENHPQPAAFYGFAMMTEAGPRWTGHVELIQKKLREPLSWRKPKKCFVNSMSDLFHESLPEESIAAVFSIMAQAPHITFQILTKRASRLRSWFDWAGQSGMGGGIGGSRITAGSPGRDRSLSWPLQNVWLGVSVEDQAAHDERVPLLLQTPAAKRFVSYEPALEAVDFDESLFPEDHDGRPMQSGLNWIIVGGESGHGARPFDVEWARSTVAACKAAGVAVFVKQLGAKPFDSQSLGSERYSLLLEAAKGGDPEEWPEDLRVREFPR